MMSTELAVKLAPFALLANRHAMSPIYNALEISADCIRGCSPWGILEVDVKIGTTETFWVKADQFVGVIKTLPAAEVVFELSGSTLSWTCHNANGKLGLLSKLELPKHEWEPPEGDENVDAEFPTALQLGSLSASRDIGMSSAGVTGVALTWEPMEDDPNGECGTLYIASSDNTTMSVSSTVIAGFPHWPESIVIGAEAAAMLVTILRMSSGSTGAFLDIREKMICAYADEMRFRLMIRSAPPMLHDILTLSLNYSHSEIVTKLPNNVVKSFIARATALSEAKAQTQVNFSAMNGGLRLSFAEGAVVSDEQYKIAELTLPDDFPAVRLDGARLARALSHTDMLALDAFDKGVLTLFISEKKIKTVEKTPEFSYLINGAQAKGA